MLKIAPLTPAYQQQLWEWLHLALWDPPPAPLRPREVLESPAVRIYAENWGRTGDVGVVGTTELDGGERNIGACWMRTLPAGSGLAWVDDATPQLGIAVEPCYQGRGWGAQLMRAALEAARAEGYSQVSLTVHPQNPAIGMYERCGFQKAGMRSDYHLMIAKL
ncbi:GNAT family N-acetyltransferase [Proteobacteria bacterium 005FR1]|nr:GNAT family N-acetyltransferase [Proteobacteria bacterium 005FR1]